MPDVTDTIQYYVERLLWEYQKPKAQQTIAILVKQALMDGVAWSVQDGFDLNTAVGAQLDTLGKYVGLPRSIGSPTPLPFFGFVDYLRGNPQNENGLTDYGSGINNLGVFYDYGYNKRAATDLGDVAYYYMLLFKLRLNVGDMTLYGIQQALQDVFSGAVRVVDNADMTLDYFVGSNLVIPEGVLVPYLPKPMGVLIAHIYATNPIVTGDGDNVITEDGDTIVAGNL